MQRSRSGFMCFAISALQPSLHIGHLRHHFCGSLWHGLLVSQKAMLRKRYSAGLSISCRRIALHEV